MCGVFIGRALHFSSATRRTFSPPFTFQGPPRHAEQVRNRIDHAWIDASNALFDIATLPGGTVSRDLFAERVLVERNAFMEKQAEALLIEQKALQEEGWKEVMLGAYDELRDRLYAMEEAPIEYDKQTTATLAKLEQKRDTLERQLDETDADTDAKHAHAIQKKLDAVEAQSEELLKNAQGHYGEATKSMATVFLVLDPEGRVQRQYRIPRAAASRGKGGAMSGDGTSEEAGGAPKPPTPSDLSDPQKATFYTQQAIAVRAAVLDQPLVGKRLLVMMLHESVRSEALAVRREASGTTVHAEKTEGFESAALKTLRTRMEQCDAFKEDLHLEDVDAYARLAKLSESQLDNLIAILTVQCLTASLSRPTALVELLAEELKVQVRQQWRPDDVWLNGYTKLQLSDLLGTLRGPAYGNNALKAKKSELVDHAAKLFADATEGKLTDAALTERVNAWLPEGVLKKSALAKPDRKHAA